MRFDDETTDVLIGGYMSKEAAEALQRYQDLRPPPAEDPDESDRLVLP